jgi:hypothetical protein
LSMTFTNSRNNRSLQIAQFSIPVSSRTIRTILHKKKAARPPLNKIVRY